MLSPNTKNIEFDQALNLPEPWNITDNELKNLKGNKQEWHIKISYKKGAKFKDAKGIPCPINGTRLKTWQHCDIEGLPCYIHCQVPRIKTDDGKFQYVDIPWARPDSRFSLAFEAQVMQDIAQGHPFDTIGKKFEKSTTLIGRIFNEWITTAYTNDMIDQDLCALGLIEISNPSHNQRITVAIDLKNERVLLVMPHTGKEALSDLHDYLKSKDIEPQQIKHISGPLFLKLAVNTEYYFQHAIYHVDRFYVVQALNEAMERVIKEETGHKKKLTENYSLLLMPRALLSEKQLEILLDIITVFPNVGRAYKIKHVFYQLWTQTSPKAIEGFLEQWCQAVLATRKIEPFKQCAERFIEHSWYITNFHTLPTGAASMENIYPKIITAIKRTKGLTNIENVSNMILFCCGKLTFPYIQL